MRESLNILFIHSMYLNDYVKQTKTKAHLLSHNMESKTEGSPWALQEPLVCWHWKSKTQTPNKDG